MTNPKPWQALTDGNLAFFREFLKHPFQIGSVIASSRFLEQRIVAAAGIRTARTVVELGPGTGGTTRSILAAMSPCTILLSIEINPQLHAMVNGILDERLIAHYGDAGRLKDILARYALNAPEAVISGIPFSTMHPETGARLLAAIESVLPPGGRFVAYQVSSRVADLCRPFLGPGHMEIEFFNIPPLRVYRWEKPR